MADIRDFAQSIPLDYVAGRCLSSLQLHEHQFAIFETPYGLLSRQNIFCAQNSDPHASSQFLHFHTDHVSYKNVFTLFPFGFCSEALSGSDYMASNERATDEK
jgi:hypothetical protein